MTCIYGVLENEIRKCHNCGFCEGHIIDEPNRPKEACFEARLKCTRMPLKVSVHNHVQLYMAHMIQEYNKDH